MLFTFQNFQIPTKYKFPVFTPWTDSCTPLSYAVSGGHFWNPHCTFLISYFSEVIYTYLFQNEFSPFYLPANNMYEKEDAICLVIHQESNNKPKTKCSIECGMYLRFNYVSPYPLPYAIWGIGWRYLSFHDHFNWRSLFMDKFYRFWESI